MVCSVEQQVHIRCSLQVCACKSPDPLQSIVCLTLLSICSGWWSMLLQALGVSAGSPSSQRVRLLPSPPTFLLSVMLTPVLVMLSSPSGLPHWHSQEAATAAVLKEGADSSCFNQDAVSPGAALRRQAAQDYPGLLCADLRPRQAANKPAGERQIL